MKTPQVAALSGMTPLGIKPFAEIPTIQPEAKTDINAITSAIMTGDFTNKDIDSLIQAVKIARTHLGEKNKQAVTIGTNVSFTSRSGRDVTGVVTKVAIKNITVLTPNSDRPYLVPANMVRVVD
jgi:hypothetical protein